MDYGGLWTSDGLCLIKCYVVVVAQSLFKMSEFVLKFSFSGDNSVLFYFVFNANLWVKHIKLAFACLPPANDTI